MNTTRHEMSESDEVDASVYSAPADWVGGVLTFWETNEPGVSI